MVLGAPSNPKSLYFYESEQTLSRHTPRAPLSGSEAGSLAGSRRGSIEPPQFLSMRFLASVEMSDASRPDMAGAAFRALPATRGS